MECMSRVALSISPLRQRLGLQCQVQSVYWDIVIGLYIG